MQLIGEIVFHKKFGKGEILDKSDRIIIIQVNEFFQYYLRVNKLEQEETESIASEIEKQSL